MDETIKQNITKVVVVVVMFILLLCTITANSKYGKLQNEVDGYKYEITDLEKKNQEYEELIESYKQSQLEDKETIAMQLETITELETKIETKDSQIKQLTTKITELETQSNKLSEEITTLQKSIKEQGDTITFLNTSINDLNNKLLTATNQVTTLTNTNINLTNDVTNLNNKLESINTYTVVNSEIEFIETLKKGGNVILKTDILMSTNLVLNDVYASIDLNGYNLVVTTIALNSSSLEIKDSKSSSKLSIVGDNEDLLKGIKVDETSTLRITNGNYEGKNLFQIEGTLYVINANFNNKQEEIINKLETSKVEILGGTFII